MFSCTITTSVLSSFEESLFGELPLLPVLDESELFAVSVFVSVSEDWFSSDVFESVVSVLSESVLSVFPSSVVSSVLLSELLSLSSPVELSEESSSSSLLNTSAIIS